MQMLLTEINCIGLIISEACSDPQYCKNGGICHVDHEANVCDCQGNTWVGKTCAYRKCVNVNVYTYSNFNFAGDKMFHESIGNFLTLPKVSLYLYFVYVRQVTMQMHL